jgi:hypothetical protein
MHLETPQDHRKFFKTLCTEWLKEANATIPQYPIQDSLVFATTILDCVAHEPYEVTFDIENLTLLQSMKIVALAQISLVDLPSIQRLIKRAHNIRVRYRKRIEMSGWEEKDIIRVISELDLI